MADATRTIAPPTDVPSRPKGYRESRDVEIRAATTRPDDPPPVRAALGSVEI